MSVQLSDFDTTVTCEEFFAGNSEPESIANTCPNCGTRHQTLTEVALCGEEPEPDWYETCYDGDADDTEYPW